MNASELYALSQNDRCEGMHRCHWCLSPCSALYKHDDVRFLPFVKSAQLPKNPSGHYCCAGCYRWRMAPVTVNFTGGGFLDRQNRKCHSWFFNRHYALALETGSGEWLYTRLLGTTAKEPFVLSITTNGERMPNLIHLMECNVPSEKDTAQTDFKFTIDRALFTFNLYELEEGIKHGPNGKSAGVRELLRIFGTTKRDPVTLAPKPMDVIETISIQANKQVGRPNESIHKRNDNELKRMKRYLR